MFTKTGDLLLLQAKHLEVTIRQNKKHGGDQNPRKKTGRI